MSATQTVMIENVHELVQAIVAWHQQQVSILKHMLEIPQGTEMTFSEGTDPIKLEGTARDAFKAGITVGLSELGELPFTFDVETNGTQH